jgi:RNA polymerase sigma factor (sigma-70 family)
MGVLLSPSDSSLDDLIFAAQAEASDDTDAMAAILSRFDRDITFIANTSASEWNLSQDAAQGARMGLVKAVRAHTLGTAGFRSYANRYMRSEARRAVDAMTSEDIARDPDLLLLPAPEERPGVLRQRDLPDQPARPMDFDAIVSVLSVEQQSVARDRYVAGRTVADIAAGLGISAPAVSQRLSTIHNVLRSVVLEAVAA